MFDFRLQVFYTVAKRLNFTKAAEELYITQPAVTKHIQELESYFKLKLFERNGTKIKLTPAGGTLLKHTEALFAVHRDLQFEMNTLSMRMDGKLKIGASTTVAQYVLPQILARFHQRFKDIEISLLTNNTEQIENALLKNDINIGIIEGHSKHSSIKYSELVKDEIVLVTRNDCWLAEQDEIDLETLINLPFLLREPGSGTLEVIAHALKPHGIKVSQLNCEMQLGSSESIKQYLLNADCVAFISIHCIFNELKNKELKIVKVKGLNIQRYFYYIQQQGDSDALSDLLIKFMKNSL